MDVDELEIPDPVLDALTSAGFRTLHPPQAEAIPIALTGRNLVAAIPTASGKSLIGMIPALKLLHERRGKVLYIVPLKALASEKRDDFQTFAESLGFKVHMSTGDLDSEDRGIDDADIIISTSEKTDSMIRHGSRWMNGIRLVIADEVHNIHDPGRGPTLEVAITKLRRKNPDMQVIALSATISNAEDLARWLDAELIRSEWRPVPLREGVFLDGTITFNDGTVTEVPGKDGELDGLVVQAINDGGQCLVFVNSRRSTEAVAVRLCGEIGKICGRELTPMERSAFEGDSETTEMGLKLSSCVAKGTAFHNAGLTYRQRKAVEDGFKAGTIKCIVATPTLAAGINLPARRVVVRETNRFEKGGNVPIPVMEIKQMCGRAGRPGYDPYGEAVLVARSQLDADHLTDDYINHDTERVTSKLFSGNAIRTHILGILATGDADSEEGLADFLRDTFYGSTSQMYGIESVVEDVVDFLEEQDMVERVGDRIEVRPFGKRVSDLYIDPVSASILRDAVMRIDDETDDVPILIAAAMTPDVLGMYPKKSDTERLCAANELYGDSLLVDPYDVDDYLPDLFDSDLKVALLVHDWIDEIPEDRMTKDLGIGPGDIRSKVDMMDWIIYAMGEVAYIFNPVAIKRIRPLTTRIRYGVKAELIDLVALRGVGRTRARALFKAGYPDRDSLTRVDERALASMPRIGPALAASIKRQVGSAPVDGGAPVMTPDDAMMDEMAAAYGEAAEPVFGDEPQEPVTTGVEGKKRRKEKVEETGPKQASLFDF